MTNKFYSLRSLSIGNGSGLDRKRIGDESASLRKIFTLLIVLLLSVVQMWGAYDYSGTGTFNKQSSVDGNGYYVFVLTQGAITGSASDNYITPNTSYTGSGNSISNPATTSVLQVTDYTSGKYYVQNSSGKYLYSSASGKITYSNTSQYWTTANSKFKTAQSTVVYMGIVNSKFRPYSSSSTNPTSFVCVYKLAASYTITPASNNTNYGTVSLSNGVITATPKSGYRISTSTSYSVSPANSATVVRGTGENINKFTVTPSANTTVTINFEAIPLCTVTLKDDNSTLPQSSAGASVTLPSRSGCTGYTFAGWSTTNNTSWTTTAPTIISAGNYTPTENINLYPVYTKEDTGNGFTGYTKVTSAPSDWSGQYLITGTVSNKTYTANGTIESNLLKSTKLTPSTTEYASYEITITKNGQTSDYYLQLSDGTYLGSSASNSTNFVTSDNTPNGNNYLWNLSTSSIQNKGNNTRYIKIRNDDVYDFRCYTSSNGNAPSLWKRTEGSTTITYYISAADCCTPLASINGSVSLTQETTGANAGKLTASWPTQNDKTGWAANGLIVKIYAEGNTTPVHTSSAISKDATSYTATGFTPGYCTTYYATLTPQKADNTHCEGVESTEHTSVTTKGQYTYHVTLDGMQLKDGEEEAADNCSDFSAKYEPTGTNVLSLTVVSVTNAGEEGTGWIWDDSDGSLLIDKAYVTGNVEISLTGNKPEDPIVTPSTSSLNFGTNLKIGDVVPTSQTFTISGSNLTANLTVASSNTSLYVVTVTSGSLTPTAGEASATITVTPQAGITASAGTKSANITISGGGLAANVVVVASMTVLQTYSISWVVNGGAAAGNPTTSVIAGNGITALPTSPTNDGCEDGKTFIGWTATAIVGSTDTKPSVFTTAGSAPTIDDDMTFYAVFATPGVEGEEETDVLTRATTGVTSGSSTYTAWSNKKDQTDAVYAGKSAGGNNSIQLRTSGEDEGVITTTSGGKAKKVTVVWDSNTASGRTVNVYGKNSAYSSAADLHGDAQGTLLGSIVYGTSTELNITGDYAYIGLRSSSSALYLTSVSIKWETVPGAAESGYITSCAKQVAVTATAGGSATIEGGAVVDWTSFETDLTLVATPDEGYVFAGWSYDDEVVVIDDDNAAQATANSLGSATITANFVAASTINANKDNLNLVVYVDEAEDETETITFTSSNVPQYGSVIYTIEDEDYDENDTYIVLSPSYTNMNSGTSLDQTVTLSFGSDVAGSFSAKLVATSYNKNSVVTATKVIPITLTVKPKFSVTVEGAHAATKSATPNTGVKDGATVTLSQTAADSWVFQKWTISYTIGETPHSDDLVGNTFTMPAANVTATAVYAEETGEYLDPPTNATAGTLTSHSALLSWTAVEHASSYSVHVVGTNYEQTFNGINTTSYTVTGLKGGITYSWTVKAIGDGEDYYDSEATNGAGFTTTARILSSIAIKTNATKMTYNEGETFNKTGLEVTATYDDETTATISATNLVVPTTALTAGTTSITVSYTENDVLKSTTLSGITVNELGSVTWSANGITTVVKYAEGQAISFPATATGCFGKSFVGWSESTIDGETDDAPTLVTSATMGATSKTYYAVFAILEENDYEKSYGFEDSEPDASYWTVDGPVKDNGYKATGSYAGKINSNNTYVTFKYKVNVTNFSFNFARTSNNASYNVYIEKSTDGETWTAVKTVDMSTFDRYGSFSSVSQDFDGETALYVRFHCYNTTAIRYVDDVHIAYSATTGSKYATSCCTPYNITISDAIEHGTVSTGEVTAACEGTEITLSANVVDEGYEFGAWTVMQGESDITESNVEGNVLTMPAGNVTVSASFNKIPVTGVTISGEENVQINNDVVWTLDITPAEARPTIVWSTANDAVATVNNGTVHGVAVGSTTITATVDGTPYNKTINVIAATVLDHISISDPQTAFTMGDDFVAPETVTANYIYEVGGAPAPSADVTASATVSGYNMNVAGQQKVTVSYEDKKYEYNITVAPWTLHLQTKRMYGNDEEKTTTVDAEVTTLEAPTALSNVAGLCEGYTQLGYITSSENIDAEPAEVLTSYTPSANNETLYGVFQKVNYAGETLLTEDFSDQEGFNANFPTSTGYKSYNEGSLRIGSGSNGGSITSKALDLSHNFKVEVSAQRYGSDNSILYVDGSETKQQTLTSSYIAYTFEFDATENTTIQIYTPNSDKRININSIRIYTVDDIEYTSVYDCREPKDVTYEIGNDKVVWTACENTTVMEGQNYTLCANEPSLQGYDFGGWIINGDEENVKAAGAIIEVAEDLTITPKFTEHVYDYSYALAATATNGTITSVSVNGVAKDLAEVALHDGDAVVVTATPNTNYELSEWTHSENVSLTTDGNTASFTVAVGAGDMTIAAIFVEKAKYTMTLNVFGRTYTTKQGHEGDTYSSVLDGAQSPALTGYTFQGWSTDAENADAIITGNELLTADITLYAIVGSLQPTGYVYNKVTSLSGITDDGYYLIVNEEYGKAFDGSRNSSSDLDAINNYINVTVNENQIISNSTIDAAVVTIVAIPETDPQKHYIKTATGYYIGNNGSNGLLANTTTVYNNALSFNDGNFVVNSGAKKDNVDMVLRYNNSSNKFGYYKGTQEPIQLYKRGDVHQEIIPEAEPAIEISTEVSASTSFPGGYVGDVTVVNGGSLNADINLSVGDLIIHSTLGKGTGTNTSGNAPGNSGQIVNGNNITVTGDVYLELELTQDAAASAGWYAFSVPFQVDAMNGVYYGDTKLVNEKGYAIMSHDGALRAKNEYAWKKFRGIMQPGVFYVITVGNTDYKTLRFKKVAGEALVAGTDVAVSEFPSQTGNNADGAWNGIGNPNLQISNLSTSVTAMQFYDHKSNSFIGRSHSVNLVVGSAFFIQYNSSSSVSIPTSINVGNGYLAPQRERNAAEEAIYEVQLTNATTGEMEDNLFLTAREDATSEYEIGRDLAKLSMGTAKCAQMWVPAYGTQLCAADFQLVNNKAAYPLTLNAPSAGTYSISTAANENADLFLTYEGSIIWNLSMGEYTIDLNKGTTNGYGILLQAKIPQTPTGIENGEVLNGANGVQKIIVDDKVFILRGGQMYDVTGKAVK